MTDPSTQSTSAAPSDSSTPDRELEAIQAVLRALAGLDDEGRQRVVDYVFRRLGLALPQSGERASGGAGATSTTTIPDRLPTTERSSSGPIRDIRSLKDAKQPRSAIEMAALVGYYLSELASQGDRKGDFGVDEITKYFKQAGFPLPGRPRKTLLDAKAAGYVDSSARGAYKLNPVGHNLVVHGLPATGNNAGPRRTRHPTKKTARRARRKSRT